MVKSQIRINQKQIPQFRLLYQLNNRLTSTFSVNGFLTGVVIRGTDAEVSGTTGSIVSVGSAVVSIGSAVISVGLTVVSVGLTVVSVGLTVGPAV